MTKGSDDFRRSVAARAAELTGVDKTAVLAELSADGRTHHAASRQLAAAIEQAIRELEKSTGQDMC
ncbi:hypothetical protein [Sphingomonas crocodyli]|jgi:LmbE family N-acetylglucosaminyl deacetylase|uniref:Uncharacterized protein n=1 Tax=Sphingomonas crocodyli TaxID=1979270 RepID=A0A437LYD6_9SPHN|nr:hypothetical protein [Sphingomonas crocodyli]RVT90375.1 hypothetical protein EOD43_19110 [Sphingomonas crocodyli]